MSCEEGFRMMGTRAQGFGHPRALGFRVSSLQLA